MDLKENRQSEQLARLARGGRGFLVYHVGGREAVDSFGPVVGGYLFVNDATSGDGTQEFGVLRRVNWVSFAASHSALSAGPTRFVC